jgi:translation elongation factor P/translation initiation factor 5A
VAHIGGNCFRVATRVDEADENTSRCHSSYSTDEQAQAQDFSEFTKISAPVGAISDSDDFVL